jgi:hypothetical protein
MPRFRWFVAFGVLAAASAVAEAQQAGGSAIRGRIIDQQGAVLPGVTVVVTHQESGTFRETVTGADGTYFVTGLIPGPYRISGELQGFRRVTQENVRLEIGNTTTLELKLEVGAFTEALTVTGDAPLVDLTSAQVGGNVSSAELTELPTSSRNFMAYVALLPGVQLNPSNIGSDSLNINGQHGSNVLFVIDGGNNNDDMRGGSAGAQARPALESIQEFQVITNQFDAEYGRGSAGIVNAVTKQGSNTVRGSAFGYFTGAGITARDFFVEQQSLDEPDTSKQQWGGTIGGPIVRDKAHFFVSFEHIGLAQGISRLYPSRPDMGFSEVLDTNFWNTLIRGDYQMNAKNTIGARWLRDWQPIVNRDGARNTKDTLRNEWDNDQTLLLTYNLVLGDTRLNTIRAAITRENVDQGTPAYREAGGDQTVQPPTLRHVSFDAQSTDFALHRILTAYQLDDSFSWFVPGRGGDHDLKFGLQYLYAQHRQNQQGSLNGVFSFPSDRPFNAADFSTYPEQLEIRVPGPELPNVFTHSLGWFAQDKWQLRRQLTLSLGVRYDVDIAPLEERFNPLFEDPSKYPVDWNNIQPRFGLAYNAGERAVIRGGYGIFHEKLWTDRFEPYVREGVFANSFLARFPVDRADPGPSQGRLPSEPLLQNGPVLNRDRIAQLYPPGTLSRSTAVVYLDTPERTIPYSHQVSVGYERQVGTQVSFGADYVHSWARDQVLYYDLNPGLRVNTSRTGQINRVDFLGLASQLGISPFQNRVIIKETIGESEYDGLNLQIEKRFGNYWGARASYALGYARGNTDGSPTADNNFQVLQERNLDLNWGPSNTDRTHSVSMSGRLEVPRTGGLTLGAVYRFMSGRPITIQNQNIDANQNGILFDPLPAGTYSGVGQNAITVENDGGRNGARGPNYAQLDLRVGYRLRLGAERTLDLFGEIFNVTNEPNFALPTGDMRSASFLSVGSLLGGGIPRQLQVGLRMGF